MKTSEKRLRFWTHGSGSGYTYWYIYESLFDWNCKNRITTSALLDQWARFLKIFLRWKKNYNINSKKSVIYLYFLSDFFKEVVRYPRPPYFLCKKEINYRLCLCSLKVMCSKVPICFWRVVTEFRIQRKAMPQLIITNHFVNPAPVAGNCPTILYLVANRTFYLIVLLHNLKING